jgi:uncharacterized repeat protein (TIGR03803 family)
VTFDQAGNLYGTTYNDDGAIYKLMPSGSGWTEDTLHIFGGQGDGSVLMTGVIFDPSGNFYGTTQAGGTNGGGTVFEFTPSGSGWTETILYDLPGGGAPGNLARDASGNLYGPSCGGGIHGKGSIFKLTPSGGSWTETDLYDFSGGADGWCPVGNVTFDAQGNLYGVTSEGGGAGCFGSGCGVVWKLTP